jgi:hypothetical protein
MIDGSRLSPQTSKVLFGLIFIGHSFTQNTDLSSSRGELRQGPIRAWVVVPLGEGKTRLLAEVYSPVRRFLIYAIPVVAIYAVLLGGLFWAMLQPPVVFGHIMSKLPMVSYILFPFEPMWLVARRGALKVGDQAPDFNLKTADGSSAVRLSSFRGQKPVVLIFGSHT